MTGLNCPSVNSSIWLTAALCRSKDLGVNAINGRRTGDNACRRSRWK